MKTNAAIDNTKTKAIFFDWDGTLVDTIPTLFKSHNMVRQDYGFEPFTKEQFFENVQFSSRELYPRLYGDDADAALTKLYNFVEDIHLQELTPLPYALELIKALHAQNYIIGIISNKKHKYLIREVSHLGWDKYVSVMGGAGYAAQDKPNAAPLLKALTHVNITPESMMYVGDTETDLKAARATQCLSALILNNENKDSLLKKYNPNYVVNDCAALSELLTKTTVSNGK